MYTPDADRKIGIFQVWLYGHLLLVIGLTTTGVGMQHVITSYTNQALPDTQCWLVYGTVAFCL